MLCHDGFLSLWCFLGTSGSILVLFGPQVLFDIVPQGTSAVFWGPLLYYALINMIIRFKLKGNDYQIGIRAAFLGFMFAISFLIASNATAVWKPFGFYCFFISLFHYSEYIAIAWCNPRSLSVESFILNHSVQYGLAAVASWTEFVIEAIFFPDIKQYRLLWLVGITMCLGGELLRKVAMVTARSNFSHMVQYIKNEDHQLITHGIYSIMRHPSYVGWFWWAIGTQVILANPICIIVYAIAGWKFFNCRIYIEEITLLNFFGREYFDYQQSVPTGLPFITGYQVKPQNRY